MRLAHACGQQETQIVLRAEKGSKYRRAAGCRGVWARAARILTAAAAASDNFCQFSGANQASDCVEHLNRQPKLQLGQLLGLLLLLRLDKLAAIAVSWREVRAEGVG